MLKPRWSPKMRLRKPKPTWNPPDAAQSRSRVLRLYKTMLCESEYFFDKRTRTYLRDSIKRKFRERRGLDVQTGEYYYRQAKTSLKHIREANSGNAKSVKMLLKRAWGAGHGNVRDSLIYRLTRFEPSTGFPIDANELPIVLHDQAQHISQSIDSIYEFHDAVLENYVDHAWPIPQISDPTSAVSSLYIDLNYARRHVHRNVMYPPYHNSLRHIYHYSGKVRALLKFIRASPQPKLPQPKKGRKDLPLSRANNIIRKHYLKMLKKIPMPVNDSWLNDVLPYITPCEHSAKQDKYLQNVNYRREVAFRLHGTLFNRKNLGVKEVYRFADEMSAKERSRSRVPAKPKSARFFRRRYKELLESMPRLSTTETGFYKAEKITTPRLPLKKLTLSML